jgi:hypothetical protein
MSVRNPRNDLERSRLVAVRRLKPDDEIIIEATGNASASVRLLSCSRSSEISGSKVVIHLAAVASKRGYAAACSPF